MRNGKTKFWKNTNFKLKKIIEYLIKDSRRNLWKFSIGRSKHDFSNQGFSNSLAIIVLNDGETDVDDIVMLVTQSWR